MEKKVNNITFMKHKEKESAKIIGQSNISLSSDEHNQDTIQDQGVEFS